MTLDEFLAQLKKTAKKMPFMLVHGCQLRTSGGEMYCPICAVCVDLTGRVHANSEFHVAAGEIGLGLTLAGEIATAADDSDYVGDYVPDYVCDHQIDSAIRTKLVSACLDS